MSIFFGLIVFLLPFSEVGPDVPKVLKGHSFTVRSIVYSPDGNTFASLGMWGDKTIKLWNAKTGELIHTLTEHTGGINVIAYSPDGKILASASDDKTVKLWNVKTGELKHTLTGYSHSVDTMAYSPDGKTLSSASSSWNDDHTIKLWNVETGDLKYTLTGHSDGINAIAYSPDGKTLASASGDKTVMLWNVETGELKHTLTGHSNRVRDVAYSPNGKILASASDDNIINLWDVKTGELKNTLTDHFGWVRNVAYSSDGKILVSASDDKTIKLWNTETREIKHSLVGYRNRVNALAYSPTESILASVDDDRIKLWNTKTGKLIVNLQHSDSVNAIAYSPDGQTLVSASGEDVHVWDVSAKTIEKLMFAQLSELPEKIQEFEEPISNKLNEVIKELKRVDGKLIRFIPPQEARLIKWFEKLHRLEKEGNLEELKKLEIPNFSKYVERIFLRRKEIGVERLELNIQVIHSDLPNLAKLRKKCAVTPILARVVLREEFEAREVNLLVKLSDLENFSKAASNNIIFRHMQQIQRTSMSIKRCCGNKNDIDPNIIAALQSRSNQQNQNIFSEQGKDIPITQKTKPLPHNGLFTRRNNAFGSKLTTGIKELLDNGVMIEGIKIRFDDFMAQKTEGIPIPQPNNALTVSHGIAAIPDYQKRDKRATHYLEIALRTADTAPLGHPETKAPPVNYIFVIDTSGSMSGEKLDTVKTAIRELFDNMKADDVLGIIEFNSQVKTVLKATPIKNIVRDEFVKIISSLTASGGTDINLGLKYGIDEISRHSGNHKVNQIFLFSDGNPTSGETNWIQIRQNIDAKIRESQDGLRLSTFGFGTDASRKELDKLAGISGGQNTFVIEPEDVKHTLRQELERRTHLAAINVQMQIEIESDISILHLYGHDLITDPIRRAAVLRDLGKTKDKIKEDYGVEPPFDIVTEENGIRIFVPNLAVGETYWVVFEIAVPEQRSNATFGKATVQYLDTFARQNEKYPFNLLPKGQIAPQWVAQHALGLWTSEEIFYALDDLYDNDLDTAEKRISHHISVIEAAINNIASEQLRDDVITLKKFRSLAQNLGKVESSSDSPQQVKVLFIRGLNSFGRLRNGPIKVKYGQ